MGCDIHLYLEKKKIVNGKEEWINCDRFVFNEYYDPADEDGETEFNHKSIYNGRNYSMFAILADVRNDGKIKPIAQPRGLPADCHKITKREAEEWDLDGHSHSYLTVKELILRHQTDEGRPECGYVSPKDAENLEKGIFPNAWCGWTSDESWVYREWVRPGSHLDGLMEKLIPVFKEELWIFKDSEIENKWENFRIVFWFDN